MEILGVGPLELLFILLIALIVLGPGDMVKAGRTLGRFLRKVISSPEWRTVQKASRELRYLPNRLMREANLEDLPKELGDINKISTDLKTDFNKIGTDLKTDINKAEVDLTSWTTPPDPTDDHSIQPESEKKSQEKDSPETPAPPVNPS